MSPEYVRPVAANLIKQRYGEEATLLGLRIEQIERRVLRYVLDYTDAAGNPASFSMIGKVYRQTSAMEAAFHIMKELQRYDRETGAFSGEVGIPEACAALPGCSLVLMTEVGGSAIRQMIRKQTADTHDMEMLADGAVALHKSPLRLGEVISLAHLAAGARNDGADEFAAAQPGLAPTVHRLKAVAEQMGREHGDRYLTQTHGDLHLGQVHSDHEHAWLVDLDPLRVADPAFDLAEVYSNLKRLGSKNKAKSYVAPLREAFMRRYFGEMGWEIAGRVPIYECFLHLRRAIKCNRVRDDETWEEDMTGLVGQIDACLDAMEKMPAPHDYQSSFEMYEACVGVY